MPTRFSILNILVYYFIFYFIVYYCYSSFLEYYSILTLTLPGVTYEEEFLLTRSNHFKVQTLR